MRTDDKHDSRVGTAKEMTNLHTHTLTLPPSVSLLVPILFTYSLTLTFTLSDNT